MICSRIAPVHVKAGAKIIGLNERFDPVSSRWLKEAGTRRTTAELNNGWAIGRSGRCELETLPHWWKRVKIRQSQRLRKDHEVVGELRRACWDFNSAGSFACRDFTTVMAIAVTFTDR